MNSKLIILGLMLLPAFLHAQNQEKCPDVVVLPKGLYDSFQTLKANLNAAEREVKRDREVLEDLKQRYLGCEKQVDVAVMLKQADESLQAAEASRKKSSEAFAGIDGEVRAFILDAHGRTVAYRFYDAGYGDFGRVVTTTFTIQSDNVTAISTFYLFTDIGSHA